MLEPQLEVVVGSVGWLQFVSSRGQRNRKKEIRFRDLSLSLPPSLSLSSDGGEPRG